VLLIFETPVDLCKIPGHTNLLQELCENLRRSYRYVVLTSESVLEKSASSIFLPCNQSGRIM